MAFFELILVSTVLLFLYLWRSAKKPANYPDGPRGIPVLGNLHQLGREPHKVFMELQKTYGDIFSVQMGSYNAVVFNNFKDIRDILSLNTTTARPAMPERADRCGGFPSGIIFNSGHSWSEQRRFALKTLRDFGFGKKSMESIVQEEAKELVETFRKTCGTPITTPNKFNAAVLNVLWQIVTGQRFSHDDPTLKALVTQMTSAISQSNASALFLFVPWIYHLRNKLPGGNFKRRKQTQKDNTEFVKVAIKEHLETFQEDAPPRDFIDVYLAEMKKTKDPESSFYGEKGIHNLEITCLDLFVAGAETTATTLSWLFLLMGMNPSKQDKLYLEIKKVIGLSRLPTLNDRPSMPYTEAVISEVMRHSSIVPLSAWHNTTEEIRFKNYVLPKDTLIIPNLYGAMRDCKVWEGKNPEKFSPERFLTEDEQSVRKSEALMPFSVGKRICLGMSLAQDELFLFVTTLFQSFKIEEDPKSERLKVDYYPSFIRLPKPQNMILIERNPTV